METFVCFSKTMKSGAWEIANTDRELRDQINGNAKVKVRSSIDV